MQPKQPPKQKQKLSQKFKHLSQQQLRKQPPIYLLSSIKDKSVILDLDLLQSDDIVYLAILFTLPIVRISLYTQADKGHDKGQEGKKVRGNNAPIYATAKFRDVIREIGNAVVNLQGFRSLIFERVPLTIKHMLALKQSISSTQNLKQLSFKQCNLTDDHLQAIKSSIAKNESLVILDLSHNKFTNIGGMVGKIMSQHSSRRDQLIWFASLRGQSLEDDLSKKGICEVNLQGNQLNDRTALELIGFLKDDQWSRCLNLRNNRLTQEGVRQFAKLMKKNSSLISLDLRGNPGFSKEYSIYILKKLKQNIEKYKEQKKSYTKRSKDQKVLGQILNKNDQHKSYEQRHQSLQKKTEGHFLEFTMNKNNITSFHKSSKNQITKQELTIDDNGCQKCKRKTLEMLKLQKRNLDLQIQIKKLRHILLTRNIDISAILPHSHPHIHNNSQSIIEPFNRAVQLINTEEDDLIFRVQQIMNELTKIMDNMDLQQNTQINLSNNVSNAHSLSNTIPLFAHPSELEQFEESSIQEKQEKQEKEKPQSLSRINKRNSSERQLLP